MNEPFSTFDIIWCSFLLSIPTVVMSLMITNPLIAVAQIAWLSVIGVMVVNNGE